MYTIIAAAKQMCSPTGLAWRGIQLDPTIPPFNNSRQLLTPFASNVTSGNVHLEHPNPTMDRGEENWCSLNGVWELDRFIPNLHTLPGASTPLPETILVPFPIESALGGVRNSTKSGYAFYRRSFSIPPALRPNSSADSSAVLLHFEAIDWESHIYLNNELLDIHQGG